MIILEQYVDQLEKLRARERELLSNPREHVRCAILREEIEEITEVIVHLSNLFPNSSNAC